MDKGWVFTWPAIFSYKRAQKFDRLEITPLAYLRANQTQFLIYLNKPFIAFISELGRCNVTF